MFLIFSHPAIHFVKCCKTTAKYLLLYAQNPQESNDTNLNRTGKEQNNEWAHQCLQSPQDSPSLHPSIHKHNATTRRQLSAKNHLWSSLSDLKPNSSQININQQRHNMDPAGGKLTTLHNHHRCIYLTSGTRIPPPESCSQTHRAMPHSSAIWLLQTLAPPLGHQNARTNEQKTEDNKLESWRHQEHTRFGNVGNTNRVVRAVRTERCDVMCEAETLAVWLGHDDSDEGDDAGAGRAREDGWWMISVYIHLQSFQNVEFIHPLEDRKRRRRGWTFEVGWDSWDEGEK